MSTFQVILMVVSGLLFLVCAVGFPHLVYKMIEQDMAEFQKQHPFLQYRR